MGELPISVTALGTSIVDPEIGAANDVDTAVATLRYGYGYDQRLEILGSEGQLQVKNIAETALVKSTKDGVINAKPTYFFLERYMPAYQEEWAAFVDAVSLGSEMPVTLKAGVDALVMAEAATQSAASGMPTLLADM